MAERLEATTLVKTGGGYEMCDADGETIASYQSWEPVAEMFRQADYSEEYIASRKAKADSGREVLVVEKDE